MTYPELYAQGILISSGTMIVAASILVFVVSDIFINKPEKRLKAIAFISVLVGLIATSLSLAWFFTPCNLYLSLAIGFHIAQLFIVFSAIVRVIWFLFKSK